MTQQPERQKLIVNATALKTAPMTPAMQQEILRQHHQRIHQENKMKQQQRIQQEALAVQILKQQRLQQQEAMRQQQMQQQKMQQQQKQQQQQMLAQRQQIMAVENKKDQLVMVINFSLISMYLIFCSNVNSINILKSLNNNPNRKISGKNRSKTS